MTRTEIADELWLRTLRYGTRENRIAKANRAAESRRQALIFFKMGNRDLFTASPIEYENYRCGVYYMKRSKELLSEVRAIQ